MLCEVIQNMMCYEILMASCEQPNWFLAKNINLIQQFWMNFTVTKVCVYS